MLDVPSIEDTRIQSERMQRQANDLKRRFDAEMNMFEVRRKWLELLSRRLLKPSSDDHK